MISDGCLVALVLEECGLRSVTLYGGHIVPNRLEGRLMTLTGSLYGKSLGDYLTDDREELALSYTDTVIFGL